MGRALSPPSSLMCPAAAAAAARRHRLPTRCCCRRSSPLFPAALHCAAMAPSASSAPAVVVDTTLNPRVAALKPSKTMALTDLATRLKEEGADIIALAAGEPDVSQ